MAKAKTPEPKITLERKYTVPLRPGWLKVPKYKRANKAMKTLKQFIARHMKLYDSDLRKVKIDNLVNNEIRFRGMRKPLAKIEVNVKKFDNGTIKVELVNIPTHIKFAQLREEKKKEVIKKKVAEKAAEKTEKPEEKPEGTAESEEAKEKEASSKEETMEIAKKQHKTEKHIKKESDVSKTVKSRRKALSR